MDDKRKGMSRVWFMLGIPPILFLIVIIVVSVYFGMITQGDAQAIAENTSTATPYILLIVQVLLLLFLLRTIRADKLTFRDIGWQLPAVQSWWQEILIGVIVGVPVGFLYIFALSPLLATVQRVMGDYVPPNKYFQILGQQRFPFLLRTSCWLPLWKRTFIAGMQSHG